MAQNELHLKVTLRIYSDDDQRCFGPGIATLLQRVREHHSLRAGAASMEMAYSKAWRIIRTAESVFGCKLLSSTIGGNHGGGAVLTPQQSSCWRPIGRIRSRWRPLPGKNLRNSLRFTRIWTRICEGTVQTPTET